MYLQNYRTHGRVNVDLCCQWVSLVVTFGGGAVFVCALSPIIVSHLFVCSSDCIRVLLSALLYFKMLDYVDSISVHNYFRAAHRGYSK